MWIVIILIAIFLIDTILSVVKDKKRETKEFNNGVCNKCNIPFRLIYINGPKDAYGLYKPEYCASDFKPYEYDKDFNMKTKRHIYKCSECKNIVEIEYSEADKDIFNKKREEAIEYENVQKRVKTGMSEDVENYWN